MQTESRHMRKRSLRLRQGSPFQCLLCYAAVFALPALWQYIALTQLYPRKLAATAPDAVGALISAFPFLEELLSPVAVRTVEGHLPLREVLAVREQTWLTGLAACALAAWLITLLMQLFWRFSHRKPRFTAKLTQRAIASYRFLILMIFLINGAFAALIWQFGVRQIPGRTIWDYVVSFGVFALLPLSAVIVSRLAAPAAISGKHAFFKRL